MSKTLFFSKTDTYEIKDENKYLLKIGLPQNDTESETKTVKKKQYFRLRQTMCYKEGEGFGSIASSYHLTVIINVLPMCIVNKFLKSHIMKLPCPLESNKRSLAEY